MYREKSSPRNLQSLPNHRHHSEKDTHIYKRYTYMLQFILDIVHAFRLRVEKFYTKTAKNLPRRIFPYSTSSFPADEPKSAHVFPSIIGFCLHLAINQKI